MLSGKNRQGGLFWGILGLVSAWPSWGWAAENTIDKADTAWMLVACALVLLMTPGLALFYGGMVHSRNVLSTLMHSVVAMGLLSFQWIFWGYSLSFGPDIGGVIGDTSYFGLRGVGMEPNGSIPHLLFMMYQGMFAIITPALISGAIAERMKFSTYCVFIVLWATLVYNPVAHWVWGPGGWLAKLGVMDFAGGIVVHTTSGFSALVLAILLGPRLGFGSRPFYPHNLGLTVLGGGMLWFGWYGFNAGSALSSGTSAVLAFITTHCGAASGMLAWMFSEWWHRKQPSTLGAVSGMIAGLATVTPAAGFISPAAALLIGAIGGGVCYWAVMLKIKWRYDDSLDVFGVHGVGGVIGSLLLGIFATTAFGGSIPGALEGRFQTLTAQVIGVGVVAFYSVIVTWGLVKLLEVTMGLRVNDEQEREGLDVTQHGEHAYEPNR